jgi:hypothetical protein
MKKTIILAGNNPSNLEWSQHLKQKLNEDFDNIFIYEYQHWQDPKFGELDFERELSLLQSYLGDDIECNIIAKSAGNILTLYAIACGIIQPQKIICVGILYSWAIERNHDVMALIKKVDKELLIIQQEGDFMITYKELISRLKSNHFDRYTLVKIPGSDHAYQDIDDYLAAIHSYIGEQ